MKGRGLWEHKRGRNIYPKIADLWGEEQNYTRLKTCRFKGLKQREHVPFKELKQFNVARE